MDLVVVRGVEKGLPAVHHIVAQTVVHVYFIVASCGGNRIGSAAVVGVDVVGREVARYLVVAAAGEYIFNDVGAFPVYGAGAARVLHLRASARNQLDDKVIA